MKLFKRNENKNVFFGAANHRLENTDLNDIPIFTDMNNSVGQSRVANDFGNNARVEQNFDRIYAKNY